MTCHEEKLLFTHQFEGPTAQSMLAAGHCAHFLRAASNSDAPATTLPLQRGQSQSGERREGQYPWRWSIRVKYFAEDFSGAGIQLTAITEMKCKPTILFAEDSESDMILIELGFEKVGFPFGLQFVPDGTAAIEYLDGQGRYRDRTRFPSPCVLLTDLKMPKMDGFGLLAWVRSQEQWQNLPVIVVTGSNQAEDWQRAMELGANSYVVKELLMRPPPALFEAILRYASPVAETTRTLAKARRSWDD